MKRWAYLGLFGGILLGLSLSWIPFAWSARSNAGSYSLPVGNPVTTGATITSKWANTTLADLGQAVTDSLDRRGRGGMLAPLQLTNGTSSAPALTFASELGLGVYRSTNHDIRIAMSGSDVQQWNTTATNINIPALLNAGGVATTSATDTAGFASTGNGVGSGILGTGGATGAGVRGQGHGQNGGVQGTGGENGGPGGYFVGGTGVNDGPGVKGIGGGANSDGVVGSGQGVGAGGRFNTLMAGPTAIDGGVIAVGSANSQGGVFTGGSGNATGLEGHGTGSSAGLLGVGASGPGGMFNSTSGPAVSVGAGDILMASNYNPSSTVGLMNKLTPKNLIKAWAFISGTVSGSTIHDGFNIASASSYDQLGGNYSIDFAFATHMASANYSVQLSSDCTNVLTSSRTTAKFTIYQTQPSGEIPGDPCNYDVLVVGF